MSFYQRKTYLKQLSVALLLGGAPGFAAGNFNPDISVNFLGLAQYGTAYSNDRSQSDTNGLSLQEAEIQFLSAVDPYLRASALFSIAKENGEFGVDPEEVFVESTSLPGVTLRAGKFKLALGKHNQLHTHAYPFIDAPLIHQTLTGEEGLNEVGFSAGILLPTSWYSEVVLQAFDPSSEDLFAQSRANDIGGLVHLKNLVDVNDDLTMEFGLSAASNTSAASVSSSVAGADLTFKWRPSVGGKYNAVIWSTEYLFANRPGKVDDDGNSMAKFGGMATWMQYQFGERWWAGARAEGMGWPQSRAPAKTYKESANLSFFPSEFSGFRFQYDHTSSAGHHDHAIALQYNITIGAHPAHAY